MKNDRLSFNDPSSCLCTPSNQVSNEKDRVRENLLDIPVSRKRTIQHDPGLGETKKFIQTLSLSNPSLPSEEEKRQPVVFSPSVSPPHSVSPTQRGAIALEQIAKSSPKAAVLADAVIEGDLGEREDQGRATRRKKSDSYDGTKMRFIK